VPRKFNCGESYIVARFLQGVWEKRNNSVRSRNFSLAQKIGIFVFVGFSCRHHAEGAAGVFFYHEVAIFTF